MVGADTTSSAASEPSLVDAVIHVLEVGQRLVRRARSKGAFDLAGELLAPARSTQQAALASNGPEPQ